MIVAGAVWILSYFVARYLLDNWSQSQQWEFAIVSLPMFAFFWLVWVVQRALRRIDELQRRIHLEALAVAFPTTAIAVFASEYMRKAGAIAQVKPDYVLMLMLVLWAIGFLIAWRRYR